MKDAEEAGIQAATDEQLRRFDKKPRGLQEALALLDVFHLAVWAYIQPSVATCADCRDCIVNKLGTSIVGQTESRNQATSAFSTGC